MAVAVRATSSLAYGTRTNSTVNKPTGTASGDMLVAIGITGNASTTQVSVTPPSGWTAYGGARVANVTRADPWNYSLYVFTKPAGGSEPASYTWTHGSADTELLVYALTGADATTPISPAPSVANNIDSTNDIAVGTITPDLADSLLIYGAALWNNSTSAGPSGMTERYDAAGILYVADQQLSTTSATGTKTANFSSNGSAGGCGFLLVIEPPSGGANIALTGQALAAAAGSFGKTADVALSGQSAASAQGSLASSAAVALAGQALAGSAGALAPSASVALSGLSATFGQGSLAASSGSNTSVNLTGQSLTTGQGSLSVSASVTLSGQAASTQQGTLAPGRAIALSGQALASSAGSLGKTAAVALAGQGISVGPGTLTPSATGQAVSVALTGQALTISQATFAFSGTWTPVVGDAGVWSRQSGQTDAWTPQAGSGGTWH